MTPEEFWADKVLKERIELWHKYESVAMHFNELIIRFRLQALGGVAALTALAAFIFNEKLDSACRPPLLLGFTILLFLAWTAMWVLDAWYYQKLLLGAVDAITALEEDTGRAINLSTKIEERLKSGPGKKICAPWGPCIFYGIIWLALLAGCVWALFWLCRTPPTSPASTPAAPVSISTTGVSINTGGVSINTNAVGISTSGPAPATPGPAPAAPAPGPAPATPAPTAPH